MIKDMFDTDHCVITPIEAIEELQGFLGSVKAECGKHVITLRNERYSDMKRCVTVYVNNQFVAKWADMDCNDDEVRFLRTAKKRLIAKKAFDQMPKGSKDLLKASEFFYYRTPFFLSARTAIRHIMRVSPNVIFKLTREF